LAYWLAASPAGTAICLDPTVALILAVVCQILAGLDAPLGDFSRHYAQMAAIESLRRGQSFASPPQPPRIRGRG
jgi:hypothetical protein